MSTGRKFNKKSAFSTRLNFSTFFKGILWIWASSQNDQNLRLAFLCSRDMTRAFDVLTAINQSINIYICMYIIGLILGSRASKKTIFPNSFRRWPFSRESFKLWILEIYVTSNIFSNLMMSFSIFPRRGCFRQVGFERRRCSVFVV